jgi:hypothetical protein
VSGRETAWLARLRPLQRVEAVVAGEVAVGKVVEAEPVVNDDLVTGSSRASELRCPWPLVCLDAWTAPVGGVASGPQLFYHGMEARRGTVCRTGRIWGKR